MYERSEVSSDPLDELLTRPTPRLPSGPAGLLCDRILVHTGPRDLATALEWVDRERSGLWVGGRTIVDKVPRAFREFDGVTALDPEAYVTEFARPDRVFALPEGQLFGDLDSMLSEQLTAGASVALTPTCYVGAHDSASLQALVRQARAIERADTVLVVPLAVEWLAPGRFLELQDALAIVGLPVALIFGGQRDPLERQPQAVTHLRLLERELPTPLMRARTDLSAFDGLAHGAFAGAIGFGSSRRHLVPADTRPDDVRQMPSLLVPELMRYVHADVLAEQYADNRAPPRCFCLACGDRSLAGFGTAADRADAGAHNVCVWTQWLVELQDQRALAERAVWWRDRCRQALAEHAALNKSLGRSAFRPRPALERYASETP